MVARPADYPWSSHGANASYRKDPLLVPYPEYLALGMDTHARAAACRAIVEEGLEDAVAEDIRAYLQQQRALGSDRSQEWVRQRTVRFAGLRGRERPRARGNCP